MVVEHELTCCRHLLLHLRRPLAAVDLVGIGHDMMMQTDCIGAPMDVSKSEDLQSSLAGDAPWTTIADGAARDGGRLVLITWPMFASEP
eukprot:2074641-Amphidinium_carterae.1